MINQRQIDFRQEYRSRIIGWYDGYVHGIIIYAMGAAAFEAAYQAGRPETTRADWSVCGPARLGWVFGPACRPAAGRWVPGRMLAGRVTAAAGVFAVRGMP